VAEVSRESRPGGVELQPDRAGSLLTQVFCANVHYGICQNKDCWAKDLCAGLQLVMPEVDWPTHMSELRLINLKLVMQQGKHVFCKSIQQFNSDPSADDTTERQRCKYANWMLLGGTDAHHTELPTPAYLAADAPLVKKRALAGLRLGNAPIRTARLHDMPYNQRHCKRCNASPPHTDNEDHWLFSCAALRGVRQKHAVVVAKYGSIKPLMMAVYDSRTVDEVMAFVVDATKVANRLDMSGQRQAASSNR
jgi:hypothetical protein